MKKIYSFLVLLAMLMAMGTKAQTTLVTATGDGGFESAVPTGTPATDFTANGWNVVNGTNNRFFVGTTAVPSAGTYSAYTGTTATSFTGEAFSTVSHFYRDITIPAGDNFVTVTFKYKVTAVDATFDFLKAFLVPVGTVPVAGTQLNAGQIGSVTGYDGTTTYATYTIGSYVTPGTTQRLVFSFRADGVSPHAAASVDEISVVSSSLSGAITSKATGGLWSSPDTWVGGIVPSGSDVVIADGSVVTIDQAATVRNLTIGQGASGILQWNATANVLAANDILVSAGAKLNMFTAVASPNGTPVYIAGNFTNNGTVHAAYVNANHALLNFNSPASSPSQTLSGTGTFEGGIISGLFFQNLGSNTISTSQNIITRSFALTAGALNTNGKLSINNTAQFYGQPVNQQVYEIVVTNMGSGYSTLTPPTVTIAAPTGAGVTATAIPNIDDATGTLRSITITGAGDGYRSNPAVTITGGTGTGAAAVAVVNTVSSGTTAGLTQKSGAVTITGGININSSQSVGAGFVTAGGVGYASVPDVGFALPTGYLNLVTSGGSGYTSAPTVTVSGGIALTGSTNPTFTVVVAQGKVVSVIPSAGGTLWQVPPTLTITGGGGTGATAAYPANCLATATATVTNGMVSNITITNGGFGYTAAPAMGLVGGGATTNATGAASRVGLYGITMNWFFPAPASAVHQDDATIPANRRVNVITMTAGGLNLNSDLELYASAPITLTSGLINAGANTVYFSHPAYAGVAGNATSSISGSIRLSAPGGSVTRTFPFEAPFVVATGTGSLATGSTVTSLTVTRTGAPSGAAVPTGTAKGTRAYRLQADAGAVYGTNPTVTMNFNSTDALVSDAASLLIGQGAGGITGPWTVVSAPSGSGGLPATGSRTTATAAPGPIVPTGDDYFAWTSAYSAITSATTGDWNNPSTWVGGVVPVCTDNVIINNTHNVTVNAAGAVSKSVSVSSGGTLTLASGDLTVGCTAKNNSIAVSGTLTVNAGVLNVNGNFVISSGAKFNQAGGSINVDGNDAGTAATSVATGTVIFAINAATAADINLTGGTITVVDPHIATTNTIAINLAVAGNISFGPAHTFRIGDGISTDAGSASGFIMYNWPGTGIVKYGNLVLETVTGGTNRFLNLNGTFFNVGARNITINSGAELRQVGTTATGAIYVDGNLTVNAGGTLTAPGIVYFGNAASVTSTTLALTPSTLAQTIGGAGTFRNATTSPTANLGTLSVDNTNAAGVTAGAPLTLSTALNLVAGTLNTTSANLVTVGFSGATTGTITRTAGMVNGPLKKWYAAATGTATLPIGTATLYKPATINFTTAPATAGTITATFSSTSPNFPNAAPLTEGSLVVNSASTQGSWFIEAGDGLTGGNYTATFTGNGATDVLDYTKTVLIKRPSAGGEWVLDGAHVTSTGSNSAPVVSRTGMAGFSEFAIGGELMVALPIAIEYFRGTKQTGKNVLDWKVSVYNSPTVTLTLERSPDGRKYDAISTTNETSARCLQPFNYKDLSPLAGINYYRLRSTDIDGKVTYSNVVALLNKDKGFEIVSLAPNPVTDVATLNVTSAEKAVMEIVVTDLNGKQVSKQKLNLIAGNNQALLNFKNVAAGTYQVTGLTGDGQVRTLRFVKQ